MRMLRSSAKLLIRLSVSLSLRYSRSGSALPFSNGRTARESMAPSVPGCRENQAARPRRATTSDAPSRRPTNRRRRTAGGAPLLPDSTARRERSRSEPRSDAV